VNVVEINALSHGEVINLLLQCCGSREWATKLSRQKPFADADDFLQRADRTWLQLGEVDWLEAFAAHPRIGERTDSAVAQREQASALSASSDVGQALAVANAEYEARFGFIFIVFASGKSAEEMLELLSKRLGNDRDTEIKKAAAEQMKITRLRLQQMIGQL
jgi:OHCU decarboxylase